jgi:hypothetical protein
MIVGLALAGFSVFHTQDFTENTDFTCATNQFQYLGKNPNIAITHNIQCFAAEQSLATATAMPQLHVFEKQSQRSESCDSALLIRTAT